MIEIKNVSFSYNTKNDSINVLNNISLSIKKGEYVSFIGPSGCGKTTLLHLIGGIIDLQEGSITINNVLSKNLIKKNLYSIIFQELTLLDWLTIKKNIELPIKINPLLKYVETKEIMENMGLSNYSNMYPYQLSGGLKTRVGIARSLMSNTPVLLMDECFANLDEVTRERMNIFLLEILTKINRTLIFITHSISEAVFMSDRVIVFSKKPSVIAGDIKIDIPRPRLIKDIENNDYIRYRKLLRELLNKVSNE